MGISKQAFYEGAALHILARKGKMTSIRYVAPFFKVNDHLWILLKYSAGKRSPWGFTFTPAELRALQRMDRTQEPGERVIIGLVCGADGVAALGHGSFSSIVTPGRSAAHIACYRRHGEHYAVGGPNGSLDGKVAPSEWSRILG